MSNICQICRTEFTKDKCKNCGFEMPRFTFLSEDDANEWYRKFLENHKKKKRCESCGNTLQEEWKFCPFCGEKETQVNDEYFLRDILGRSLGSAIFNERNEYVINNLLFVGDECPSEASQIYITMSDNQSVIEFYLFENISEDRENKYVTSCLNERGEEQYTDPALKVRSIGKVIIELPQNTQKGTPIEVSFCVNAAGVKVIAMNLATNQPIKTIFA